MSKTETIKHVTQEDLQALKGHIEKLLHTHGKQALHDVASKAEQLAGQARENLAEHAPKKSGSRARSLVAIAIFSVIGYFLGRATK
ncbi:MULTISPECIES: hypothetical protein [Komagataeibacter]|uniref:DUF3618 domain-containing protein n=2 Tax=Komagataeibacter TaxID=1434011 RepID=A0A318QYV2_9PROT|nr:MULTISPECIES: hypothetical protein [Komagataeibacter]GBR32875.1 hypothetical protein AA11826_0997 [Komagataeibacter oboediens DSM 11826]MBL7232776.1 hypothetical protein [Komagataeibacter oboediens]MBT0674475.1 hypothetical protein [Komagataeibacter oboediens]MBT0680035.1 hypothetical protein [Komagataeibacter oboediens]MBV0889704.1 hypothetical protein [Komagataeibacter oboediens]